MKDQKPIRLQSLEARIYRVLVRGYLTPAHARRAALSIVRDTHEERVQRVLEAAAQGMSCREIAKAVGMSKSQVNRVLSHRSRTDGTPTAGTIDARNDEHPGP